ncbi:MAG: deoxyribose-phosphate aldolase [Planctomycetota bacterium]
MTPAELAATIDHTLLKPEATADDVKQIVHEAVEHGFASVCVNGCWIHAVAPALRGTGVKACGVAGFPLGAMKSTVKAIEATSLVKDGAHEVDFVAHLPTLMAADADAAREQFLEVTRGCRAALRECVVKVIIESAALMAGVSEATYEKRIAAACAAATQSGCDFVKTSTGFHPAGGATVEAVKLMRKHAPTIKVKASGGIRTRDDAMKMLDAGADRLGCSAGVAIVSGGAGVEGY